MTVELDTPSASFLATEWTFTHAAVPIHSDYENSDSDLKAFFEGCRLAGRPYIDHHAASGTFRYVYFDRSETPAPALMAQLASVGQEFGLSHRHILNGDIPAECFDDRFSLPFQGQFSGLGGVWTPERVEAFVERLAQVLPRFDRPAAITALVQRAIEVGYFENGGVEPYGDDELEWDASRAYDAWCREHARPYILIHIEDYRIYCDCDGRVVSPDATKQIENLARRFNLRTSANESYTFLFGELRGVDESDTLVPDFVGFAGPLYEILNDPRTYEPQSR